MLGHYTTPPTAHVMYHLYFGASTFFAPIRQVNPATIHSVIGRPNHDEDTQQDEIDQEEPEADQQDPHPR